MKLNALKQLNDTVHSFVWGPVMLLALTGVGVYFTVKTKWFQFSHIKDMMSETIGKGFKRRKEKRKPGSISPFQAMATALAGTLGTGNIVGVSTALVAGGPGAIFWMWVSALFGMVTKLAEIVLAVLYREENKAGEYVGGPMYYIQKGLKSRTLAVLFSVFCVFASFGIGNMTQSNSAAGALSATFNISPVIVGAVMAVLAGLVMLGGIKRIAGVTEKLVPLMALLYTVFALAALILSIDKLPAAFSLIFKYAFTVRSAAGGCMGYVMKNAIRLGVSRGVFSNEAGLGSAPIAHAAADSESPVRQGLWGMFEVFFDTIVMCTITALVLLTSGVWDSGRDGASLTVFAFERTVGGIAPVIISVSTALFAFATILSWSYYGEKSLAFILGEKAPIKLYRFMFAAMVLAGAVTGLSFVWEISDTLNGLMAVPNLIALIVLRGEVISEVRKYKAERKRSSGRLFSGIRR